MVLLPEPVGPVTRTRPCGRRSIGRKRSAILGGKPSREILQGSIGFEQAHHDFFAVLRRQSGNAQIDAASADFHQEAAVLRRAALGDVHVGKNFDAGDDRVLQDRGMRW